ncbi:hypothetical protein NESM_000148800 [Novymonas esmeraldas]|uniref:Uncharacterized protein n=1 Tax=Novymonas esmeraldas TaxID=1808958 RepID=A0AAW0F6J4_9TRYP
MSGSQLDELHARVQLLGAAVQEAVATAREAKHHVEQQARTRPRSPDQPSMGTLVDERLRGFETFIIRRVREEAAQALAASSSGSAASAPTTTSSGGRRLEILLEAQRTRGAAVEQRLVHLESKLNALTADVVSQAQAEVTHRKHLAATLGAKLEARAAAEAQRAASERRGEEEEAVVQVAQHVAQALAAMHARVDEQHAELARWREQSYELMRGTVAEVVALRADNARLRDELEGVRRHLRHGDDGSDSSGVRRRGAE